jgi:hypothetical protein
MKWFKKKKRSLPEDTTCRNCGAQTVGRYCHECGQDVLAGTGQPVFKIIGQTLGTIFALEGKTPRTLAYLIIRPGFLSEEYKAGRINKYVHPVTLFWMSTLIFFALLVSQIDLGNLQKVTTSDPADKGMVFTFSLGDSTKNYSTNDENTRQKTLEFVSLIANYFTKFAPYAGLLLVPVFALLLASFFWRKKFYYVYHLIFALHLHTFLWFFFTLLFIPKLFINKVEYPLWVVIIFFAYMTIAFHRFYKITWWKAIRKSIGIIFLYLILITLIIASLLLIGIFYFFPETHTT